MPRDFLKWQALLLLVDFTTFISVSVQQVFLEAVTMSAFEEEENAWSVLQGSGIKSLTGTEILVWSTY